MSYNAFFCSGIGELTMLMDSPGKLFVYTSDFASREKRLTSVRTAAERLARCLNLGFEIKTSGKEFEPIYVYYKNGEDEPIPIYCDTNSESDSKQVGTTLRGMMFVLSFHPKHSALREIRKEIIRFS